MRFDLTTGFALALMAATAAAQTPPPAAARPTINPRGLQCEAVEAAQILKMTADQRLGLYCAYEMAHGTTTDAIEKAAGKPAQSDLTRLDRCSSAMNKVVDVMVKNRELADCGRVSDFKPGAPKAP